MKRVVGLSLIAAFMSVVQSGCALQGTTPPSTYYMLDAVSTTQSVSGLEGIAFGVGPIAVVDYLDRPQIVTRTMGSEVAVNEEHRWVGPIREAIIRVLVNEIAVQTGSASVYAFPWPPAAPIDMKVLARVGRFDADETGLARLEVQWWLQRDDEVLEVRRGVYEARALDSTYSARVVALNDVLSQFARAIVTEVAAVTD